MPQDPLPLSPPADIPARNVGRSLLQWFDSAAATAAASDAEADRVDWLRVVPFVLLHLGCLGLL